MKNRYLVVFALFTMGACVNRNEPEKASLDSLANVNRLKQNDSVLLSTEASVAWLKTNLNVPFAKWRNVQLENYWVDDSLELQPFEADPQFYRDYAPVLRWSPDSSYLLDIGSYGSIAIKNPNGTVTLEGGEPDTEIAVVFTREQQKARLLFAGPSSNIINATWLDGSEAMIVGTFNHEDNIHQDTLLWLVDVKDKLFRLYNFRRER